LLAAVDFNKRPDDDTLVLGWGFRFEDADEGRGLMNYHIKK
jgi:hypothetical protein